MYIVQTKLYRFGIVVSFATGKFVDVFLASIFRFFFFWRSATQRRVVETYMLIKGKPCSIAISPLLAVCAIASVKFPTFLG